METFDSSYITEVTGVTKPILLIDEAVWCKKELMTTKCFLDEDLFFWKHHFVGNPVMPGTYMLEMLAQSAAFLDLKVTNTDKVPIIVSINNVRFLKEVKPGSELYAELILKKVNGSYYTTIGKIKCEGKVVCKAEMVHYVKSKKDC